MCSIGHPEPILSFMWLTLFVFVAVIILLQRVNLTALYARFVKYLAARGFCTTWKSGACAALLMVLAGVFVAGPRNEQRPLEPSYVKPEMGAAAPVPASSGAESSARNFPVRRYVRLKKPSILPKRLELMLRARNLHPQ